MHLRLTGIVREIQRQKDFEIIGLDPFDTKKMTLKHFLQNAA